MRAVVLCLIVLCASGAANEQRWTATAAKLDSYTAAMFRLGRFNGVVLVASKGHVYRRAYGYSDFGARVSNTTSTQFEIASISKMFTAAAILKLRDKGALQLNDSLCRYLTPCPQTWRPITIQEVLDHRSGIPDYEDALDLESATYYDFMTKPDSSKRILERQAALPLDFVPGTRFSYSNTGYVVLGFIVESAAHQSYAAFLHRAVLDPAGLRSTGVIGVDPATRLAKGYSMDVAWAQRVRGFDIAAVAPKEVPKLALTPPSGDAGLFSTVDDLLRWTEIMLGSKPELFNSQERAEIFSATDGYGDGWFVENQFGLLRYSHTGELPGFLSDVDVYPTAGTTTIMMDNVEMPTRSFTRDVQAIALGQPYDNPYSGELVQLAQSAQNALFGTYAMTNGDSLCVTESSDHMLLAKVKGKFAAGLLPFSATRFYMPLSSGIVTFEQPPNQPQQINLRYDGVDHPGARGSSEPCQ